MKRLILLIAILAGAFISKAENDITIGIVMPDQEMEGINPASYKILQSKLEKILTSAGVSSFGGDFVMYPVVNIVEENLIEGGLKNFYKIEIDLSLNIANLGAKTMFMTDSWTLSGSGARNKNDAIKNAFSKLNGNDPRFKEFIQKAKTKIGQYYADNRSLIFANAESLASSGNYEEAIALLASYPRQVSGYAESQQLLKKIYLKYIDANGARILNEARAAFAVKNYEEAVRIASRIDPDSSLYGEAKSIIDNVRSTIKKEEDAENRRAMKALEIAADVEKNRVNAIASVAKAYYGRKIVNYNTIRVY